MPEEATNDQKRQVSGIWPADAYLGACGRGSCRGFWRGGWENARPRAFGQFRGRGTQLDSGEERNKHNCTCTTLRSSLRQWSDPKEGVNASGPLGHAPSSTNSTHRRLPQKEGIRRYRYRRKPEDLGMFGRTKRKLCTVVHLLSPLHVERHEADAVLRWRPDDA